jgi:hypothetical protein
MAMALALSQPIAAAVLVIGVIVVAALLAVRQWYERRHRETGLSDADARHFARQDFRRAVVGVVLVLLALGVAVGSQLKHLVAGRPNAWFLGVWLAVIGLILVVVWLALLDWIGTWLYARRHRRALIRERIEFLRSERRRRAYRGNGQGPSDPSAPIEGKPTP